MTAILASPPKTAFFNTSGAPLVGGKLYTYRAGTSTPATTWIDAAQSAANTNPIILDSRGEASIFLDPLIGYKFELRSSADAVIWTQDNIQLQLALGDGVVVPSNLANGGAELGLRNRLINGDFRIDQRFAGASTTITAASAYVADRWYVSGEGTGAQITARRLDTSGLARFPYYLRVTNVNAVASPSAAALYAIRQPVEAFNLADLNYGVTTGAQPVTVSFWVRSSLAGIYSAALSNTTRSYVAPITIDTANTWEQKTVTIPGDTAASLGIASGLGLWLSVSMGAGANFTTTTTSAWQTANKLTASGSLPWHATAGATFDITAVQLEVGSTATPFDFRPLPIELAMCQRYYNTVYVTAVTSGFVQDYPYPPMRVNPTVTIASSTWTGSPAYTPANASSLRQTAFVGTAGTGVLALSAEL